MRCVVCNTTVTCYLSVGCFNVFIFAGSVKLDYTSRCLLYSLIYNAKCFSSESESSEDDVPAEDELVRDMFSSIVFYVRSSYL